MTSRSDDYLGFRTDAQDNDQTWQNVREELQAKVVNWSKLQTLFIERMENFSKRADTTLEEATQIADEHAMLAGLIRSGQLESSAAAFFTLSIVSAVGAEVARTHERLATVEKELQALKAPSRR